MRAFQTVPPHETGCNSDQQRAPKECLGSSLPCLGLDTEVVLGT